MPEILDEELALGFRGGPRFSTSSIRFGGGREVRNSNWSFAPKFFTFSKNWCDLDTGNAIVSFFYERRGSAETWWLKDWTDFSMTSELIGTGDGAETDFQLIKSYGTTTPYSREIYAIKSGTLAVTVGGSPVSPSSTTNGLIVLSSPPAGAAEVRATCQFYSLVRFGNDEIDPEVGGPGGAYMKIDGLTAQEILL